MQFFERDLTGPELDRVHAGFDDHARRHGNVTPPRTRHGFVAMDGDVLAGCATGLRDNRWYCLTDLWVAELHRRQGIGARLLGLWERRVAADGVKNAYTWTAGFEAPEFYRRRGWSVFAELADYYENGHGRFGLRKALDAPTLP